MLRSTTLATDGLHVFRGFLSVAERQAALRTAAALSARAHQQAARSSRPEVISGTHNVNSLEKFKRVSLTLEDGRTSNCEHFGEYGDGHRLTYFRGILPSTGVPRLLERIAAIGELQEEVASSRQRHEKTADAPWKWRLTLNHYPPASGLTERKGFPWHRDLIANGAATMILNLGAPGGLEFGEEPNTESETPVDGMLYSSDHTVAPGASVEALESITLNDGDLLLLTGRARWEYVHRVLPSAGGGERATLVYGVW